MKRNKYIISSDSDDDKVGSSTATDKHKQFKKSSHANKGSKKPKLNENQMTIETCFSKAVTSKRKADITTNVVIEKVAKLNKNVNITNNYPTTKGIILPKKLVSNTSSADSDTKVKIKKTSVEIDNPPKVVKTVSKAAIAPVSVTKTPTKEIKTECKPSNISSLASVKSKAAYVQFLHRSGPSSVGSKELPQGPPNCLSGKTFVITGVLDSIERDDAQALIERHGGKVTKAVSGRTTYLVVGNQPGESKVKKANQLKTIQVNEDQLFDLIRNSSSTLSQGSNLVHKEKKPKTSKGESIVHIKRTKEETKAAPSTKKLERISTDPIIVKEGKEKQVKQSTSLLVDKYCPTSLKQIIGQQGDRSPAHKLLAWLQNFDRNLQSDSKSEDDGSRFRAVLLSGPPGIGKTTTARLVCQQLGYNIVELNASSVRSKKSINGTLAESLVITPFYKKKGLKHCVIMDEVDGMAGNEDRGGINELIKVIKTTKHPIICICNDRQSRKLQSFVKYVYDLRFRQLTADQMKAAIVPIIRAENMAISDDTILCAIKSSNFDMRQVLNNLQMWSVGNTENETLKINAKSANKEFKLGPFDVIQKVFTHENVKTVSEKSDLFFYDYQLGGLFVQENYPLVRPNLAKGDMAKTLKLMSLAADSIAMGDIVSSKIHSSNNWGLLPIQAMFSSVIPGEYLHGRFSARIEFPSWLGKCSKGNKNSRILSSLCSHLCLSTKLSLFHPNTIAMDYGDLIVKKLVSPLQEGDIDSVLTNLDKFQLQKEDMDLLIEVTSWKHLTNPLSSVSSQIKSTLTRAYNKSNFKLPYANVSVKKSLKLSEPILEVQEGEEVEMEEEEEEGPGEDGLECDIMIVKKESSKVNKEKTTAVKKRKGTEKGKQQTNKPKSTK